MKSPLYTLCALVLFTTLTHAQNGQKNFIDQPYIEVTGESEAEIIPNEIYLKIVLNENDKNGRISIEKQENSMIEKLRALQINLDENLSVLDFDGYYKKKFLGDNQVTKKKTYQLIVSNGKTLGEVFRTLDALDISNISIQKVSHSNLEKLKQDNKIRALKNAKVKANDYALALNQTIGNALFVQETKIYNNLRYDTNSLNEVVVSSVRSQKNKTENISNLKIEPILLKSTILTRFILN